MLILRPIEPRDADALLGLAAQLDSMNLPAEPAFLAERIAASQRSFGGAHSDWREGVYVFVLEDTDVARCVGTSTILAKHGRPGKPYFWLEVTTEERRSTELRVRFQHKKLQLRSTEDGPTEIGGIVLDPAYRRHKARCGKALSIVRFAFMSMFPERFEREVIAEMLSPFVEPGRNLLWDAFGARFTGLGARLPDQRLRGPGARGQRFVGAGAGDVAQGEYGLRPHHHRQRLYEPLSRGGWQFILQRVDDRPDVQHASPRTRRAAVGLVLQPHGHEGALHHVQAHFVVEQDLVDLAGRASDGLRRIVAGAVDVFQRSHRELGRRLAQQRLH